MTPGATLTPPYVPVHNHYDLACAMFLIRVSSMHSRSFGHSPWFFPTVCSLLSCVFLESECYQSFVSGTSFLPLSPEDISYFASDPPVQALEYS